MPFNEQGEPLEIERKYLIRRPDREELERHAVRRRELTPAEYEELLARADGERRPIRKERWCVPWADHTLEIDVFPFWEDRAYCEIELQSPEEDVPLPDWLTVIREVTGDPRYTNSALALEIPVDPI